MVFYNDNDPAVAQWVRNLMAAGLVSDGMVDERPIQELRSSDLAGVVRAHFFSGIAGWELALKYSGWPQDKPVWTGSCPCQPFSQAGRRKEFDDERHLWPAWLGLISKCKPPTIFGEQVSSKDGRSWIVRVRSDLEAIGYYVGVADIAAAGIVAPHIRQRLYWVADTIKPSTRGTYRSGFGESGRERTNKFQGSKVGSYFTNYGTIARGTKIWRIEPGIVPLAHGVPARMVKI